MLMMVTVMVLGKYEKGSLPTIVLFKNNVVNDDDDFWLLAGLLLLPGENDTWHLTYLPRTQNDDF